MADASSPFCAKAPQLRQVGMHLTTELVERAEHEVVVALCELLDRAGGLRVRRELLTEGTKQRATVPGAREPVPSLAEIPHARASSEGMARA